MPELPEVETTRLGIEPWLLDERIDRLIVRQPQLRWPVPADLPARLRDNRFTDIQRRGKYLLLQTATGTLIVHLGMSGRLRILPRLSTAGSHDHVDLVLANGRVMRFTDPRRFGAWLWCPGDVTEHPLLAGLGPEPLSETFSGDWLWSRARGRRIAVKSFLMDSRTVVGVGNIYANEALHDAGIHPGRQAGRISRERYRRLQDAVREVLRDAIAQGGTTLRDFSNGEGKPGYFQRSLRVYARTGQPCRTCGTLIRLLRLGQRSAFYCPRCQR